MKAFATILVLVSAFGQLNARDPALTENCLNGDRSAKDCCALVPRAYFAHLKHPTNCGQFYHCDHGSPVLKDCPAGLHWSVKMDRCEWPSIAKCKGTATTTTTIAPTTTSTAATESTTAGNSETSTCRTATISNDCRYGKESAAKCCVGVSPLEDALLPNPANCGTYIQCVHEKPMVRDCPAGLHWSPGACRCEWPSIAKCNGATATTTTTTPKPTTTSTTPKPTTTSTAASTTTGTEGTTTQGSGTSTCRTATISNDCRYGKESAARCCVGVSPLEDALLPNPDNCGTYIQCVHEKPMVRDCPAGLHWSPDACRCEWPSIAKCNGTTATTTTTTTTPKPTTTSTTPKPTTTSTAASTTTGTEGTTTQGSGTSTCRTATISNDCRYGKESAARCCVGVSPLEDALLPNPDNCGTYIQCVHEKPMVRDCPDGLHWSPDACRCEWPSIAKCNGTTATTTTTPKPTTTSTTPKPTTTSTTPKPTTTSTAASTTTGTEGTTTQGSGTSTCRTATISNDCRYGKESAARCCVGVSPLEDALLPNPDNCGTYIQCVHEKPMVRDCPDGLHWSPDACRCEWPSIAKCNGTTATTTTTPKPTTTSTTPKPTTTSTAASTTTGTDDTTTHGSGTSTCRTATISNDCRYGKESAAKCCVGVSPWEDALLPNPNSCGTYLQCVHEKPMVRDCPDGLHWSPDACRCEWPSIAKCI